jgi:3'-phosphoadenosine 5'-phosphosulfate sulfotransferase (PAPS reductase)/FAD synthetase
MGHAHGHKGGLRGALRSVPDIFPIADWTFRTVRQYAMRVHLNPLRNNF